MKWFHLGQLESQTVDTFTGTKALMILINQKWWTVCFCWLSRLQHSCIHHRKILRWQESFTTCQVLHRTGDLRDSQISEWAGTHYTGSVLARSSYINKLPLANAEKCPIPSSINEILRCGVKVSWLEIFCILRGGYFCQSRDLNPSLFFSLNKDLHSQRSSELSFCPVCICEKSVVETNTKLRPATHKNISEQV